MDSSPDFLVKTIYPQCSKDQIRQLGDYVRLLEAYGKRLNLVSQADLRRLWENHVIPSIIVLPLVEFPTGAFLADLGSGGGLPAIPLKILRPDLHVHLIESSRKKSAFLKKVIRELGLIDTLVHPVHLNAKDEKFAYSRTFEVMTVRAVGSLNRLIPLAKMLLKPNGFLLAWKGKKDLKEMKTFSEKIINEYQIISIPPVYQRLSRKLDSLCLLKIPFPSP